MGVWLSKISFAQDSILQNFNAFALSNSVELSWTIKKGNTCDGINILRSGDSLNFVEIGNIPGICGSEEKSESYAHSDLNPIKNQRNYYRLELGLNGLSEIISKDYFKIETSPTLMFPNPTHGASKLVFQNLSRKEFEVSVFNAHGALVWHTRTAENYINIPSDSWNYGLYSIEMRSNDGGMILSQRLLVISP
ncbi:MAG: hypothetical protein Salg2KO_14220 [Salibacteraceae bacterium]